MTNLNRIGSCVLQDLVLKFFSHVNIGSEISEPLELMNNLSSKISETRYIYSICRFLCCCSNDDMQKLLSL